MALISERSKQTNESHAEGETEDQEVMIINESLGDNGSNLSTSQTYGSKIKPIGKNVVHQICSAQVIVTLSTAVKELLENSIDAGATNIELRLIDQGSKLIEVADNGKGVDEENFEGLALKHHTSKITEFEDLSSVATYGFRGEALSSLCSLSSLTVITRTATSKQGFKISYDTNGRIISTIPFGRPVGTTVILSNLFSPLPVRHREFLKNLKKEFSRMMSVLYGYCLIAQGVRISCTNQTGNGAPKVILSVQAKQNMKERIASIYGVKQISSLMEISNTEKIDPDILEDYGVCVKQLQDNQFILEGLISLPNAGRNVSDRQFYFINSRPCEPKKIGKIVNEAYHGFSRSQYPFVCLNIITKRDQVDVNVTPDKRLIYLQNEKLLYATIKGTLLHCFKKASSCFNSGLNSLSFNRVPTFESQESSNGGNNSFENVDSFSDSPENPDGFNNSNSSSIDQDVSIVGFAEQYSSRGRDESFSNRSVKRKGCLGKFKSGNPNFETLSNHSKTRNVRPAFKGFAKQTKIFDFMKSQTQEKKNQQRFYEEVDLVSDCEEAEDDDNDEPTIYGTSAYDFKTESATASPLQMDSSPGPDYEYKYDSDEENLSPEISFSRSNSGSLIPSSASEPSSQTSVESSSSTFTDAIIMYDDELEDIEAEDDPELLIERNQRHGITIKVDWNSITQKLITKAEEESDLLSKERSGRKFKSKILPTENSDAEEELKKQLKKEMFSQMTIIGQFNLGFIIAKYGPDVFIVDQHASDEKYNYEDLEKTTVLKQQRLIRPMPLGLPAVSENILMDNLEVFEKNGFGFEIYPENKPTERINLVKIPHSKASEFGRLDVEELIFMLDDAPENCFCRPSKVRSMLASRACRKSVMIGTSLSPKDMKRILEHMGQIEQPWNCPHGRPTLRHLFNVDLLPDPNISKM